MRFYGEIRRVDEEQRMVWGYASTEQRAMDGMVISRAALESALDDYMEYANIREMHQQSAVGVAREATVDETGLYIGAHIVDDAAWKKVVEGVYRAFSIGAKITERDTVDRTLVTGISLREISVVDRPGDPGAKFDCWRAADGGDDDQDDVEIERRQYTQTQREQMAATGAAMKDGSFPIADRQDLENAIRAVGRAKDKRAARRHITKRARALGASDLIPEDWNTMARTATAAPEGEDAHADDADLARGAETADAGAETTAGEESAPGADATERAAEGEGADTVDGAADSEPASAEADPVARAVQAAQAAMEGADAVIETLQRNAEGDRIWPAVMVEGAELRRGLSTVNRLGYLLSELAYIVVDSQWEAEIEADNSPVPGKLRAALLSLAAAYKAMSDEELAELLNGVGVDVALENGIILLAAGGCDLQRTAEGPLTPEELAAFRERFSTVERRAEPPEADPDLLTRVETLTADRDLLLRSVDDLTAKVGELGETVTRLLDTQAAPKTGGALARAVSKEEDTAGAATPEAPTELSVEDVQRALASMPEQDRALALTRAALARPIQLTR